MNEWYSQAYSHISMSETKKYEGFVILLLIVIIYIVLRIAIATIFRRALRNASGAIGNKASQVMFTSRKWLAGQIRNNLTKTEERRKKKNEEDNDEYY